MAGRRRAVAPLWELAALAAVVAVVATVERSGPAPSAEPDAQPV